eukprot:8057-Heterococcus_DN1.PRE.3
MLANTSAAAQLLLVCCNHTLGESASVMHDDDSTADATNSTPVSPRLQAIGKLPTYKFWYTTRSQVERAMTEELNTAVDSYKTAIAAAHMLLLTEAILLHMHAHDAAQIMYAKGLDRHDALVDKLELHMVSSSQRSFDPGDSSNFSTLKYRSALQHDDCESADVKQVIARVALVHTLFNDESSTSAGSSTELYAQDDSISANATNGNAIKNAVGTKSAAAVRLVSTLSQRSVTVAH